MSSVTSERGLPRTANGRRRRKRIIDAAADLMYAQGAAATSVDEVLAVSGSGKSQLYHYFTDRRDLVRAVVARQSERVLANQPRLPTVRTWDDLCAWARDVAGIHATEAGPRPCPVGSIAAETRADPELRSAGAAAFEAWLEPLAAALAVLQGTGDVRTDADARTLAIRVLAALQGALLIASTLGERHLVDDVLGAQLAAVRTPGRSERAVDVAAR